MPGQAVGMDYVLLHGTTQSTAGWERLVAALASRGHQALVVDLPVDRPDLLAADYARIAVDQVGRAVARPVVVAHSGAGLLLPAVADGLDAGHLVWLAAAVPDFGGGASFLEQIERAGSELVHEEWRRFGRESTEDPVVAAYFGFHDCDLETLRWALTTIRLFYPAAVYAERPSAPPARPSTYVLPRQDRTLRPAWMGTAARERLGVEPIEIDAGHFPHVSQPDALADILERESGGA
jgi:pimeloyl-ACP methyl ester carboxylesterase